VDLNAFHFVFLFMQEFEIKFLHKKNLYNIHLKAAKEWRKVWKIILPSINSNLNLEMEKNISSST